MPYGFAEQPFVGTRPGAQWDHDAFGLGALGGVDDAGIPIGRPTHLDTVFHPRLLERSDDALDRARALAGMDPLQADESLLRRELVEMAKRRGIPVAHDDTKAEIVRKLHGDD